MLTEEQVAFFHTNGYLVLKDFWSPEELEEARREMRRLLLFPEEARPGVGYNYEPKDDVEKYWLDPENPHRVWMLFDTPLAGDWWFRNVCDSRITLAMSQLLGKNINFHNGKARIKPPGYGSHQGWHQDFPYEHHDQADLAAALFYLDDTDVGASATEVIPGTHLQGEWRHDENNFVLDEDLERFGAEPVALAVPAGSVAIIHVLIVHRATPNLTDRNRSAIINEYKTMEARDQWGNRCAFAELPLVRDGKPF
jgi:phytanoyl-CoA hydroxylase